VLLVRVRCMLGLRLGFRLGVRVRVMVQVRLGRVIYIVAGGASSFLD
jgi:hypothetical protein